jgi:hypothetical protein
MGTSFRLLVRLTLLLEISRLELLLRPIVVRHRTKAAEYYPPPPELGSEQGARPSLVLTGLRVVSYGSQLFRLLSVDCPAPFGIGHLLLRCLFLVST